MIRYTKTKLNLFHHYFTHVIGNCIKPNFRPRDKRGTNSNTTRDKLCPLHFSMVFQECFYSFFLLVCKITAFNVYEIIQNTESNSTSEGQGETMQNNCEGQTVSLAIQHVFWEVVLLFFFLLVCEILSPVCPPKIFFKNLHIDIQHFMQHKYHLRGKEKIQQSRHFSEHYHPGAEKNDKSRRSHFYCIEETTNYQTTLDYE